MNMMNRTLRNSACLPCPPNSLFAENAASQKQRLSQYWPKKLSGAASRLMIFFFGELSQQIYQEHDCDTYRPGCFFPSVFALLSALMLSPLGGGFVMSSWHLLRYQQFLLRMGLALKFFFGSFT